MKMTDGEFWREAEKASETIARRLAMTGMGVFGVLSLITWRGPLSGHGLGIISVIGLAVSILYTVSLSAGALTVRTGKA